MAIRRPMEEREGGEFNTAAPPPLMRLGEDGLVSDDRDTGDQIVHVVKDHRSGFEGCQGRSPQISEFGPRLLCHTACQGGYNQFGVSDPVSRFCTVSCCSHLGNVLLFTR